MYLEDIKTGTEFFVDDFVMDEDEMIGFSRKYDPAPLHTDKEYAKTTRFGKLIAPGMLTFMKFWAKYLPLDPAGEELVAGSSTSVTWTAPVFAGDVLHGRVRITDVSPRNDHNGSVTLGAEIFNAESKCVLKAEVVSIVKRRKAE